MKIPCVDGTIELPDTPATGTDFQVWTVESRHDGAAVESHVYRYHVNTPWKVFEPTGSGAALVDDWMHYDETGRCTGRMPGYRAFVTPHKDAPRFYKHRTSALTVAIVKTEDWKRRLQAELDALDRSLARLAREFDRV